MEINNTTTNTISNIASSATIGTAAGSTGIFYWLNQYAGAIGLLISIIMACATITYYIFNYRLTKKNYEKSSEKVTDEEKEEILIEYMKSQINKNKEQE